MLIFHFHCGCQYPEDEAARDPRTRRILCPVHGQKVKKKTGTCEDCGISISVKLAGTPTRRCEACQKVYVKLRKQVYKKTQSENAPVTTREPKRKTDCLYLVGSCLRPPNGKLLHNKSACIGCKQYIPVALDVRDYMHQGSDSITLSTDIEGD